MHQSHIRCLEERALRPLTLVWLIQLFPASPAGKHLLFKAAAPSNPSQHARIGAACSLLLRRPRWNSTGRNMLQFQGRPSCASSGGLQCEHCQSLFHLDPVSHSPDPVMRGPAHKGKPCIEHSALLSIIANHITTGEQSLEPPVAQIVVVLPSSQNTHQDKHAFLKCMADVANSTDEISLRIKAPHPSEVLLQG